MTDNSINLAEMSMSDKDMIQDKDNSILNKSFFSEDFNFQDLIDKKNFLQIKYGILEFYIYISSKSIKKIFNMISDNNKDTLENNYLDFITCIIGDGLELDKRQLFNQNGDNNVKTLLEPSYFELLNKTKIFYIDIPKLNICKKINERIKLRNNSLEKIASLLNMNLYDLSDYIEIYILSYQENDILEERFLLRAKLMGKASNKEDININNEIFHGIKKFPIEIKKVEKCNRNKIRILDFYFNNVYNAIERINVNDENLSFHETPLGKSPNEEISKNIKKSKSKDDYLPNSYNTNNIKNKKKIDKDSELKDGINCGGNICADICSIF